MGSKAGVRRAWVRANVRCGNAEGLQWFCGNPEDALTADQWVELGR